MIGKRYLNVCERHFLLIVSMLYVLKSSDAPLPLSNFVSPWIKNSFDQKTLNAIVIQGGFKIALYLCTQTIVK